MFGTARGKLTDNQCRLSLTSLRKLKTSVSSSVANLGWLEGLQQPLQPLPPLCPCWMTPWYPTIVRPWVFWILSCIQKASAHWMISPLVTIRVAEPKDLMLVPWVIVTGILVLIWILLYLGHDRLGPRLACLLKLTTTINVDVSAVTGLGTPNFGRLKDLVLQWLGSERQKPRLAQRGFCGCIESIGVTYCEVFWAL